MKANARNRKLEWSLKDEITLEFMKRDCVYCGSPPANVSRTRGEKFSYTGLDRLDSSVGYTIDNVVPACFDCNNAKRQMDFATFLDWTRKVHNHLTKRQ